MKRLLLYALFLLAPAAGGNSSLVQVELISPTNGAVVSGVITLSARVSPNVVKVEFYRDGILIGVVERQRSPSNLRIPEL